MGEHLISGFEDSWGEGLCPTDVYLRGIGREQVWKQQPFYSEDNNQLFEKVVQQYDLTKKLTSGLPIGQSEFDQVNNWLQTTNKFNC